MLAYGRSIVMLSYDMSRSLGMLFYGRMFGTLSFVRSIVIVSFLDHLKGCCCVVCVVCVVCVL